MKQNSICTRKAEEKDLDAMLSLLSQVLMVHHKGRPDIFKGSATKYKKEELKEILKRKDRLILAAVNDEDQMLGYVFCNIEEIKGDAILVDRKSIYIDDLCVDEKERGSGIGKILYESVIAKAKEMGCYNVTLNVWECNQTAKRFYEKCGMVPLKTNMEKIL